MRFLHPLTSINMQKHSLPHTRKDGILDKILRSTEILERNKKCQRDKTFLLRQLQMLCKNDKLLYHNKTFYMKVTNTAMVRPV